MYTDEYRQDVQDMVDKMTRDFTLDPWVMRTLEEVADMDDVHDLMDLHNALYEGAGPGPWFNDHPDVHIEGQGYLKDAQTFLMDTVARRVAEVCV